MALATVQHKSTGKPKPAVRSSFLRDCWTVLTSSHCATALGVVTSYLVRHTLSPRVVGIWSAIRLIVDYAGFANLGATRAAAVEVAVATGANDRRGMRRAVRAALWIEIASSVLVAILLLVCAAAALLRSDREWAVAFVGAAALLGARRILTLSLTVLRSRLDFQRPSVSRILGAFLELVFLGSGAYFFGLTGLVAGAVLTELINLAYVTSTGRVLSLGRVSTGDVRRLIAHGAPLAAGALALTAARSAERVVVIFYASHGATLLGLYTTALLISSRVFDQANLVANVLFPRMGVRLAQTQRPEEVLRLSLQAAALLVAALVPVCVAAVLIGLPLTAWLLPRYRSGLDAVWGTLVSAAILGGTLPLRHALVTLKLSWRMCAAYAVAACAGAAATVAVLDLMAESLAVIAWVAAGTAAIAGMGLSVACITASRQVQGRCALPLAVSAIYLASAVVSLQMTAPYPVLQWIVGGIVSAPAIMVGWRVWRRRRSWNSTGGGPTDPDAAGAP